jgi:hypothetical protein
MKYILNESDTGVKSLADDVRKKLLEDLGYKVEEETETLEEAKTEAPVEEVIAEGEEGTLEYTCLFESEGNVYAILEDVYELDGELFVEAVMLEDEVATLKEGHGDEFTDIVNFDEAELFMEGAYEHDDFQNVCFIKLQEMDSTDRPHANDGTTAPKSATQVKKAVKKSGGALAGAEGESPKAKADAKARLAKRTK